MPYEKINNVEHAVGQVWTNITTGDEFLILECENDHATCAILVDGEKPSACPQVYMPLDKLRNWGNRGFTLTRKHKGKLPTVHEKVGTYNVRHVGYGAR